MIKYFIIFLFCNFLWSGIVKAQEVVLQSMQTLPNVLPPSPDAFNFTKYGNLQIGLNTGTVQINLPIYNIISGHLSQNISLDYSSNGVKVDEMASRTGINWTLRAGGVITRTVMDLPDEAPGVIPSFFHGPLVYGEYGNYNVVGNEHFFDPLVWDFYNYVRQASYAGRPDYQPDEYSYSVDGYSGKFLKRENGEFVEFISTGMKIEKDGAFFKLTAPNGNKYFFNLNEITEHVVSQESIQLTWIPEPVPTTWLLTKIQSPSGIDEFTFNYEKLISTSEGTLTYINGISQEYKTGSLLNLFINTSESQYNPPSPSILPFGAIGHICDATPLGINTDILRTKCSPYILTSINFNNGKLEIKYSDREDVINEKKVEEIKLFSNYNTDPIKIWEFKYVYSNYQDINFDTYNLPNENFTALHPELRKRLFLSEFHEKSYDGLEIHKHKFEYNDINGLPPRLSFSQDLFGYFNGKENIYFFPNNTWFDFHLGYTFFGGDRNFNFQSAQKGILKKYTYPTGGYSLFEYEPNKTNRDYAYSMKIKKIDAKIDTSTYSGQVIYSEPFIYDGQSVLQFKGSCSWATTKPNFGSNQGGFTDIEGEYYLRLDIVDADTYQCSSYCGMIILPDNNFYHGELSWFNNQGYSDFNVTAGKYRIKITANRKSLKGTFTLQSVIKEPDRTSESGIAGVRVKKIVDYTGNNESTSQKEYLYRDWEDENSCSGEGIYLDGGRNEPNVSMTICNTGGSITGFNTIHSNSVNKIYLNDGGNVFYNKVIELFKGTNNINNGGIEYGFYYENKKFPQPIGYHWPENIWGVLPVVPPGAPLMNNDNLNGKIKYTEVFKYESLNGPKKVLKKTENFYSKITSNLIIDTFIVSKKIKNPNFVPAWPNFAAFLIYKYWRYYDYVRLDYSIETDFSEENEISNKTLYSGYSTKNFKPRQISAFNSKGDNLLTVLTYPSDVPLNYPNSNIYYYMRDANILDKVIQEKKYKNNIQIIQRNTDFIRNGNLFLENKIKTSLLDGEEILIADFQKYDAKGNIRQYREKNGIIHTIIWGYNGQYPVAHIIGADYESVKEFVNESILNNPLSTNMQITNELNSFRNAISGMKLQVTTYTYIPLIGLETITDINGKKMIYEYDNFYRLKLVRDNDGNILSAQEYQYAP